MLNGKLSFIGMHKRMITIHHSQYRKLDDDFPNIKDINPIKPMRMVICTLVFIKKRNKLP